MVATEVISVAAPDARARTRTYAPSVSGNLNRVRAVFWALSAGVVVLYVYGLVLGVYGPLQLGLLSAVCIVLLIGLAIHEARVRRALRADRHPDHKDRERRGW